MIFTLFSHQWKEFWRSRNAAASVALQIFMGIGLLYLLFVAIAVAAFMPSFLTKLFPDQDIIRIFCGFLLYYFIFDIIMRFLMQELPTLAIQPYLAQNIKRKQLISFLNLRSLLTFFNLYPFILIIPFVASQFTPVYGALASCCFILAIISITLLNHFIILYVKRRTIISSWWLAGVFVVVLGFIAADAFGLFSISKVSGFLSLGLLLHPWLCVVAVAAAIAAYYNSQVFLINNLYVEEMAKSSGRKASSEYVWLNQFGSTGDLIALDIKLILRNKRPRNVIFSALAFIFYGFIIFKPRIIEHGDWGQVLFGSIMITSMFIVSYGQQLFAWQAGQFDGLIAGNIQLKTYIRSKFVLLTALSTMGLLPALLYGFLSWKIIPIILSAYLFNIGINTVLSVYFATRHYKGIDLSKSTTFNYGGADASRYLYTLFLLLTGVCLYLPLSFLIDPWAGIAALGIAGMISFLLRDWWVEKMTKEFITRKYKILEGFREK